MTASLTRIAAIALSLSVSLAATTALAEENKAEAASDGSVTGNPPADHPFAKVKPGMKFEEALAILGKPTSERAYCTGKHHIPFYFGRDRALTEYYYKDQGVVVFYTEANIYGWSRVKSCSPKAPFELGEVHYNPNEAGVAPKEGEERPKTPAEAPK